MRIGSYDTGVIHLKRWILKLGYVQVMIFRVIIRTQPLSESIDNNFVHLTLNTLIIAQLSFVVLQNIISCEFFLRRNYIFVQVQY